MSADFENCRDFGKARDVEGCERPEEEDFFREDGSPSLGALATAIQVWSACQRGDTTIAQAALIFSQSEDRCWRAVGTHYWIFTVDDGSPIGERIIEHEGI